MEVLFILDKNNCTQDHASVELVEEIGWSQTVLPKDCLQKNGVLSLQPC